MSGLQRVCARIEVIEETYVHVRIPKLTPRIPDVADLGPSFGELVARRRVCCLPIEETRD